MTHGRRCHEANSTTATRLGLTRTSRGIVGSVSSRRHYYPPPMNFRRKDAAAMERLAAEYGLTGRPRRSRAPSPKEGAAGAFLFAVALGGAWILGRHYAERRAASSPS